MEKFPITAEGFAKMEAELRQRKYVDRPAIIEAISEARAHGDLSENAEYHAAKEKQGFNEGYIKDLEDKVSRADVIDPKSMSGDIVKFGATVTLIDEDTDEKKKYKIVGEYEANLDNGAISIVSPLARALIGKKQGSSIEFTTPKGNKGYEIEKVEFI
jgi:transcription elongation factor GreA